jgi:hypothetical protein
MEAMAETLEERRAEALVELEDALEEIESGEGLSTSVEGHGIQSRVFRFEWSEPKLQISYELPTGRVLSGEDAEKDDEAEIAAAIRMALILLRAARDGKLEEACYGSVSVSCDETGAQYAIRAEDGSMIDESEGWSGLVSRLEGVLGDASDDLVVIWP